MVTGVTEGFEKKLEINGVGYEVDLKGKKLVLKLGFSHSVTYSARSASDRSQVECPSPDRDRHPRLRQAAGRPGRSCDPQAASARALQGQGHQVRRRGHQAQGRARPSQLLRWLEQTTHRPRSTTTSSRRSTRLVQRTAQGSARKPEPRRTGTKYAPAPVGVPQPHQHLRCPGHRRRSRAGRSRQRRRSTRNCAPELQGMQQVRRGREGRRTAGGACQGCRRRPRSRSIAAPTSTMVA